MKKLILLSLTLGFMFIACSKSPEEKAAELVENEVKKYLYIPDSYESADLKMDSAFAPYDDFGNVGEVKKMKELEDEISSNELEFSMAERNMGMFEYDPSLYYYKEAKEEYTEAADRIKEIKEEIKEIDGYLQSQFKKEPEFIGFKVYHVYRAKNNAGQVVMGQLLVLLNKDCSAVMKVYDLDDYKIANDFEDYFEYIKKIK